MAVDQRGADVDLVAVPTSGGGKRAGIFTRGIFNGVTYMKFGSGDTDWTSAFPTSSLPVAPARVLQVSPSWSGSVDPTLFFTTIGSAITAAVALTPTQLSPVWINIFPGLYLEFVTLPSFVFLRGAMPTSWNSAMYPVSDITQDVIIPAIEAVLYQPTDAGDSVFHMSGLMVTEGFGADATSKPGGPTKCLVDIFGCYIGDLFSPNALIGRSNGLDVFVGKNCFFKSTSQTFTTTFGKTQISDSCFDPLTHITMDDASWTREVDLRNVIGGSFGEASNNPQAITVDTSTAGVVVVSRGAPVTINKQGAGAYIDHGSIYDLWVGGGLSQTAAVGGSLGPGYRRIANTAATWQPMDTLIEFNAAAGLTSYALPPIDQVPGMYLDVIAFNVANACQLIPHGTDRINNVNATFALTSGGESARLVATNSAGARNWILLFH